MPVRKMSVALDQSVAAAAQQAADRAGLSLSAWLSHAAERALAVETGLDAARAWERDHGALTDEELSAADGLLDELLATGSRRRSQRAS